MPLPLALLVMLPERLGGACVAGDTEEDAGDDDDGLATAGYEINCCCGNVVLMAADAPPFANICAGDCEAV